MGYSIHEVKELKTKIDFALATGRLGPWETRFLSDIRRRLDQFGTNVRLSEKQAAKLSQMIEAGRLQGKVRSATESGSPERAGRWRRRGKGLLAREGRWLARRFLRDFAFAVALVLGFLIWSNFQRSSGPADSSHFTAAARSYSTVPIKSEQFTVTDGDTVHIHGEAKGTRLVGFNTPETRNAECARELELGNRATARLRELIASARLELDRTPCACAPGAEGTDACNYGRSCAVLSANGRDVGQILISEGLAVPFVCGRTSCPPTPRPWCI